MSNELIRRERKLVRHLGYGGVCNDCGDVVTADEIVAIEIFTNDVLWIGFPLDEFYCPHCGRPTYFIKIWKSLNVTEELGRVQNHAP